MKNMHFCTSELLTQIYESQEGNIITTYRTGFVPSIFPGNIVNLNDRNDEGKDSFVRKGKVLHVIPTKFKHLPTKKATKEEIERYKRKFNEEQWFFEIKIKIIRET